MKSGRRQILMAAAAAGLLALGVVGGWAGESEPPSRQAGVGAPVRVNGRQARHLVERGAVLVDVRTPAEFAAGHLDGARNIPFDEIAQRAGELGAAETQVVLYCHSGRRSGIAAKKLAALGHSAVYDLGPMSAW